MALWKPDPTFYPSPRDAAAAPPEKLAYVAAFSRPADTPGRDRGARHRPRLERPTAPSSASPKLPYTGDELHHFGWNACSSALCPYAPHPHAERRYLVVPGLRSSRIYIFDTKDDPTSPKIVKILEPEELGKRAGYSRPHTVHCGPEGLYVTNLGGYNSEGPGGVALLDHTSFEVLGQWEVDRGDQYLAYDLWWHIAHDVAVTSEWGTPSMIEDGIVPDLLLGKKYGHRLHFWDLRKRKHVQTVDLGDEHQMALELRPAHDPTKTYGFVGVVISVEDLSASIWLWHRDGGQWAATKVITIPAEPAPDEKLPPALKPFGAVPPLVTDIDLSVDDKYLYVSCWGTGELKQYDVSDPFSPASRSGRSGSAASPTRSRTPPSRTPRCAADRRWSRSAGTASGCTSPTRCTGRGTSSSTPTASGRGSPSSTSTPRTAASPSTSGSSRRATPSAVGGSTRSGCRAATRRATATATRDP